MKKLICDMDLAREYGLQGNEILVYSALCYLCYRDAWELNYTKLAEAARCGDRTTAMRICDALVKKKLITIGDKVVHIVSVQNARSSVQNARFSVQNARFCEKESTKEKEINKENNSLSYTCERKTEGEREILLKDFIPPSYQQVIEYAHSKNIPDKTAKNWYDYWEQTDWHLGKWQPRNWKANLDKWVSKGAQTYATGMGMPTKSQGSLTYLEQQEEIHRQIKAEERAKRDADWAERENNRAAAAAFFARHHNWLKSE